MTQIVWRTSHQTGEKLRALLYLLQAAEIQNNFPVYVECIEQIKALPGFPQDYDPLEDTIVEEHYETVYG